MKKTQHDRHMLTRRHFAGALAGASLAAGLEAAGEPWIARAEAGETPLRAPPPLAGTLRADALTRQTYAQDYGQIVHKLPRAVLSPGSAADVAEVVRFARRNRLRIAARGQGHQPFGQAQVEDGIVVDMRALPRVHAIDDDQLEVDAGAAWRAVLQAALGRDRTPPVLTNYLGLTIGGTLSIGGIGLASLRHGAQVDQVRALQVVSGEGDVLTCSERERPELFQAVLAGQGQCAIITRAVLRLVRAQPMVREYSFQHADAAGLVRDLETIAREERFDGAVGLIARGADRWSYALQAVRYFAPPELPDDVSLTAGLRPLAGSARTRDVSYLAHADAPVQLGTAGAHADLGLLLPGARAAGFLEQVLPRLSASALGETVALRVFFWNRRRFTRALFRIPEGDRCVYVAMLRAAATDPGVVRRMLASNRSLFEYCRALGGALYPFGAVALTRGDWRRHYQEAWPALIEAKRRYDPGDVFASGPDLGAAAAR